MKIALPRPHKIRQRLPLHEALALDVLRAFTAATGLGTAPPADLLVNHLEITAEHARKLLASLQSRRLILHTAKDFAILSQLSGDLKRERDRNRQRRLAGQRQEWPLAQESQRRFPALRGPVARSPNYNRPAVFEPVLKVWPHHHKNECPPNVEILTDACYPGELSTVLTLLEEQRSANRQPVLLYTRKALYVGVIRAPKR